jgi:tetratricopeptide (TPR) repeat protein
MIVRGICKGVQKLLGASLLVLSSACVHDLQMDTYIAQGRQAFKQGNYEAADALYRKAHKQAIRQFGSDSLTVAELSASLGATNQNMGQAHKSEEYFREALAIYEKSPDTKPWVLAVVLNNLGSSLILQDKPVEAEQVINHSLSVFDSLSTPTPFLRAMALENLAEAYLMQGRMGEAKSSFAEELRIIDEQKGPESHFLAGPLFGLAMIAEKEGDLDEMRRLCSRAIELSKNSAGRAERRATCESLLQRVHSNVLSINE